jgi:uncharacterized membrane protein YsdA (DUF1294 family)
MCFGQAAEGAKKMSEVSITIGLAIAALVQLGIIFFIVRFTLNIFFAKLTAHYVGIAIVLSSVLGLLLSSVSRKIGLIAETNASGDMLISVGISVLVSLNFIAIPLLYGWDKRLSKTNIEGQRRIPENAFHILVFMGGIIGSKIGQFVFNHKVSKKSFRNKHRLVFVASMVLYGLLAYAGLHLNGA